MSDGKENKESTDACTQWQADRTTFQRVYDVISGLPVYTPVSEIAEHAACSTDRARDALSQLIELGVVNSRGSRPVEYRRSDILARRERRGFLQGKPHFEGGFRTGTPQASSVRVSNSACGVLWRCHNRSYPVASHRLPVSKAGSLPTGQGDQRYWPPR